MPFPDLTITRGEEGIVFDFLVFSSLYPVQKQSWLVLIFCIILLGQVVDLHLGV